MEVNFESKTPNEILNTFYSQYNLGEEGGIKLSYVIIVFFKFLKVYIPNWDNRRKAVLRHDIHHLLTGYKSIMTGEFQIAAWEIGSGCMNYWAAYILNSGGLLLGIPLYFTPTFRAFILGCRTSNLYQIEMDDNELKNMKISDLKIKINLNQSSSYKNPTFQEILKLIGHYLLSIVLNIMVFICSPLLLIYNIWMYGRVLIK